MPRQHLLTDGLLCQSQPKLTGLQSYVLIRVLCPLQHVLQEIKRKKGGTLSIIVDKWAGCLIFRWSVSRPPTWMMLCMWGMRRSMRTSSNITRARHTFFRTSESSSAARANRLYIRISIWYNKRVAWWQGEKKWKRNWLSLLCHKEAQLTSMKVSMLSIRAWALLMMNWLTQAMAWDL